MDPSRLEDLRRRLQRDPASLVFAQLAEEHRRAGDHHEAVRVCRAGLRYHPEYHSARVTLGRALLALGELDDARRELQAVLREAPENLLACRTLGEVFGRQGRPAEALREFRQALALAPDDPELSDAVAELQAQLPDVSSSAAVQALGPAPPALESSPPSADARDDRERTARLLGLFKRWLAVIIVDRARRQTASSVRQ